MVLTGVLTVVAVRGVHFISHSSFLRSLPNISTRQAGFEVHFNSLCLQRSRGAIFPPLFVVAG